MSKGASDASGPLAMGWGAAPCHPAPLSVLSEDPSDGAARCFPLMPAFFASKAVAFDYLSRAGGFRYDRVTAAAKMLELPVTITLASYGGYHVAPTSNGWDITPLPTLAKLAAHLLGELAKAAAPAPAPALPRLSPTMDCPPVPAPRACFVSAGPSLPVIRRRYVQQQQQQQPQQGQPSRLTLEKSQPVLQQGPASRQTAPLGLPGDADRLLRRFGLSLDSLLTGAENAKLAKGAGAHRVILHHLPARSLAAAIAGPEAASTAPRSRLPGLAELARQNNVESLALAHNGCPWASKGCSAGCLNWSGHGGISTAVASCRARRTLAFIYSPHVYAIAILWAIGRQYKVAQSKGLPLSVRLRGTDDLPWHDLRFNLTGSEAATFTRRFGLPVVPGIGTTIPEALSLAAPGGIRLYEYSKAPLRGPLGLLAQRAAGVDTTASLAADRPGGLRVAMEAIREGFRLAVPVAYKKGAALPHTLLVRDCSLSEPLTLRCIDGDASDDRWRDPEGASADADGVAVILRTKISKGADLAKAAPFSLSALPGWQSLAGGGQACLVFAD